jgi:hypothetical protein
MDRYVLTDITPWRISALSVTSGYMYDAALLRKVFDFDRFVRLARQWQSDDVVNHWPDGIVVDRPLLN